MDSKVNKKPQKGNEVITFKHADQLSPVVNYSIEEIAIIKSTVAKNTTNTELGYFLSVCKSTKLNPFVKEIWCYKDNRNNLLVFAGRDGFLAHAQKQSSYAGIRSSEVRKKDEFKMDIFNNKITHEFGLGNRGNIIGAYAVVFRKDGEPTIEWAEFKTYKKTFPTFKSPWETHPADMIKKVAETHALKKAFGLSGIQSEYDFDVDKKGVASAIETEKLTKIIEITDEQTALYEATLELIDNYDDAKTLYAELRKIMNDIDQKLPPHLIQEIEGVFQTKYDSLNNGDKNE